MAGKFTDRTLTDDDFDYNITFPSPGLEQISDPESHENWVTEEDVSSDSNEGVSIRTQFVDKEPVIFLLGWLDCKDRYLEKYSSIYSESCITIRYTAPKDHILFNTHKLQDTARKLLSIVIDLGYQDNPIFIHSFSNGGGFLYYHMSELLKTDPEFMKVNMRGAIFDSLPSRRSPLVASKAIIASHRHLPIVILYLYAMFVFLGLYAGGFIQYWMSALGFGTTDNKSYWDYMYSEGPNWPSLYLYSTADVLVDYRYIETVIAHRRKQGCDVVEFCWSDSPHVQHFKYHKDQYEKFAKQFIEKCVGLFVFLDKI